LSRRLAIAGLLVLLAAGPVSAADCPPQPRLGRALQAALHQAQQLMEKKKPAQAEAKLAEFARGRRRPHPQLSFLRGVLAYQAGRRDQAGELFAQAVERDPCFRAALRNLAVVRHEQGRPAEAAALALRAFGLSKPKDYGLLYEAAVFRLAAGQAAKALPLLQELARRPAPQKAWLTALVRAYLETKQPGQARQVLDRLLAGWPGDAALWRLAASLATRRGDYAAAAAALAVAYRLEPPGPTGWRRLGQLYHAAGAPLAAAPFYLKAMAPKPTAPKDLDLLAQLCLQGHDLAAARAWAQKAAAAKATARRWARVGRIAMEQKDYSAARQAYAQAAKLKDKKGRYWLMAGYAAWQGERLEQAGKDFALALERAKPKSSTAKEAARGLKAVRQLIRQRQEG
jgi:predicted Zn-dependent protease